MLHGMESPRYRSAHFHSAYHSQLTSLHESSFITVQEEKQLALAMIVVLQHVLKIPAEEK